MDHYDYFAGGIGFFENPEFTLCLNIIEQPDMSTIRAKTKYDLSGQPPSRVSSNAIDYLGLEHGVSEPANKNYSCTL